MCLMCHTHYVLDVSYKEDRSRIRKDNAAENMNIVRKITANIIRVTKEKGSFRHNRVRFLISDQKIRDLLLNKNNG